MSTTVSTTYPTCCSSAKMKQKAAARPFKTCGRHATIVESTVTRLSSFDESCASSVSLAAYPHSLVEIASPESTMYTVCAAANASTAKYNVASSTRCVFGERSIFNTPTRQHSAKYISGLRTHPSNDFIVNKPAHAGFLSGFRIALKVEGVKLQMIWSRVLHS